VEGVSPTGDAQPEWRSDMVDVSGMSLSELGALAVKEPAGKAHATKAPAVNGPAVNRAAVNGPAVNRAAVNGPAVNRAAVNGPAVNGPGGEAHARDDESPLAHALRRVADDVTRAHEPIAGFNSTL